MELDGSILNEEPFKQCRIMSVPDYVRTLCIPGNFSWRRAIHTILVHFNLVMLLPAADLLVKSNKDDSGNDPFSPVGGAAPIACSVHALLMMLHTPLLLNF
jgi:hypothetical protein